MATQSSISIISISLLFVAACTQPLAEGTLKNPQLVYQDYEPQKNDLTIDRNAYKGKLYGFWLGQCIANWTGLVTEMDKIGNIGEIKTGDFYTREDWGATDQPSIFSEDNMPSHLSERINFVFEEEGKVWGADDDTDIEYMYQHLLYTNQTSILSPEQIREGWLKHIKPEEENYLWVSNQRAFDLMQQGMLPPETSKPANNKEYEMIDAQLTTEIFGLFAPGRPDVALKMANLPIRTTANYNAAWISQFYVVMHALAALEKPNITMKEQLMWMAEEASKQLPDTSYAAKMYTFVKSKYKARVPWEQARDDVYQRYQVEQQDGYRLTDQNIYCNACFAAGINFAASLISLFYGEGDIKETIKIGTLCGWDSDNPTATWGGLLGFMLGKEGVEKAFGRQFASQYNIHRTRQKFPNGGIDNFDNISQTGIYIIDRVVQEQMMGGIDLETGQWYIPDVYLEKD